MNVRLTSKSLSADFRKANWVLVLPRHIHTDGCGKSGFATGRHWSRGFLSKGQRGQNRQQRLRIFR
jgi:hypothetical protein